MNPTPGWFCILKADRTRQWRAHVRGAGSAEPDTKDQVYGIRMPRPNRVRASEQKQHHRRRVEDHVRDDRAPEPPGDRRSGCRSPDPPRSCRAASDTGTAAAEGIDVQPDEGGGRDQHGDRPRDSPPGARERVGQRPQHEAAEEQLLHERGMISTAPTRHDDEASTPTPTERPAERTRRRGASPRRSHGQRGRRRAPSDEIHPSPVTDAGGPRDAAARAKRAADEDGGEERCAR